jgi:hypothetical protein
MKPSTTKKIMIDAAMDSMAPEFWIMASMRVPHIWQLIPRLEAELLARQVRLRPVIWSASQKSPPCWYLPGATRLGGQHLLKDYPQLREEFQILSRGVIPQPSKQSPKRSLRRQLRTRKGRPSLRKCCRELESGFRNNHLLAFLCFADFLASAVVMISLMEPDAPSEHIRLRSRAMRRDESKHRIVQS